MDPGCGWGYRWTLDGAGGIGMDPRWRWGYRDGPWMWLGGIDGPWMWLGV